ncbi:hypothetical protein NDI56_07735 [Haloarcula sp. S1CR25-12]|uniref:Uncharacterized protein n=1 Tax=Haloarcula saliterrae TaxID=2950534 RepID=A0ABU2FC25_9EURY|nr:hypothetical protein [Haloarcula sp. S1CR25-12]MDS0259281.1 hypothetical protein [Haloarcula sp. S1CR25-12]
MNGLRTGPTVSIVGCVAYLLALVAPYLVVETTSAVGAYYGSGALSPVVPGLFALVGIIVFAAGREGRTDPGVAAGAGLMLGLFIVGLSVLWAVTVPESLVLGLTESTLIEQHRWAVVAASLPIPLGAVWFAAGLDLF